MIRHKLIVRGLLVSVALLALFGLGLRAYQSRPSIVRPTEAVAGSSVTSDGAPSVAAQELTNRGVTITVTPLEKAEQDTVRFAVTMNTHSVDLNYDLTKLATLQLDEGDPVPAIAWEGAQGGHHVSGTLSFPRVGSEEPGSVRVVIRAVADVPVWTFTWQLS